MQTGGSEGDLFVNSAALTATAPPSFEHRETEYERVRTALSPALTGTGPATVFLAGPPAQGKRTTVRVLRDRTADSAGVDPVLLPVECSSGTTAYDLAITLANELGDEQRLASSGYTRAEAFRQLRTAIREQADTSVVRLDGVERLDPTETGRFLSGLFDHGTLTCGVAAIADATTARNGLPRPVRDRFAEEVTFPPYDDATVRSIVRDRVSAAFADGVCPPATIDRCLAIADAEAATLRSALSLLSRAGESAAAAGAATITPDHVDVADRAREQDRCAAAIADLSAHERRTLAAVLALDEAARFTAVYEAYERACERDDIDPNRERSVHNYLDRLEAAGLIEREADTSPSGGRFHRYRPRPNRAVLRRALTAVTE